MPSLFLRLGIGIIQELANEAKLRASRNDLIQLEVVGENVQDHILVTVDDEGRNILPAFEGLLDRAVQSNNDIAVCSSCITDTDIKATRSVLDSARVR